MKTYSKYIKFFLVYIISVLFIAFTMLYNISEQKFKSEIVQNISDCYDTNQYPLYIVIRDTLDVIPIPYTPENIIDNNFQHNLKRTNAKVIINDKDIITVLLSEINYSGEILLYNAVEHKLYNIPKFSKIIYSNNYKISFTPSYNSVYITFALNY